MKKLLLLLLLLLPLQADAARLFTASNSDKVVLATTGQAVTDYFSFVYWFKLSVLPGQGVSSCIISKGNAANVSSNYYVRFEGTLGSVRAGMVWTTSPGASTYWVKDTNISSLSMNVWHHLAWTVDWTTNPDTVKVYLDGVVDTVTLASGSNNGPPTTTATQVMTIGQVIGIFPYNGDLADLAGYNAVLTQAEITALSKGVRPNKLGRPMLYYVPLDGALTLEPDYSGNGCNGTVTGATRSNGPPLIPF